MTTKEQLLKEKLENFIEFILDEEGFDLGEDHPYVKVLYECQKDYTKFLNMILQLSKAADSKGEIQDIIINMIVSMEGKNKEVIIKLKRYLKCFILILRN